jgi:hypothetical protein
MVMVPFGSREIAKSLVDGAHFTWTCSRQFGQVAQVAVEKRGFRQVRIFWHAAGVDEI